MKPKIFLTKILTLWLILALGLPAYDRGSQELAAGNGAASSSRSHALRQAGVEESRAKQPLLDQLRSSSATGVEEVEEPQLRRRNDFAEALQALLADSTEASRRRLTALREVGPELERAVRRILQSKKAGILIAPAGSAYQGYASDESDVEARIHILAGIDREREVSEDEAQQIYEKLADLLSHRGWRPDKIPASISNFTLLAMEPRIAELLRSGDPGSLEDLFRSAAYADPKLLEQVRKRAVSILAKQDTDGSYTAWERIQKSHREGLEIKLDGTGKKPHLRRWLRVHDVDPDSSAELQSFNENRYSIIGLPPWTKMRRFYQKTGVEEFFQELKSAAPSELTPVLVGTDLTQRYPQLKRLEKLSDSPILLSTGNFEQDVANLVSRFDTRQVIFAGSPEQAARFKPAAAEMGIKLLLVITPEEREAFQAFILTLLAESAGVAESAVSAQDRFSDLLNAAEALPLGT